MMFIMIDVRKLKGKHPSQRLKTMDIPETVKMYQ